MFAVILLSIFAIAIQYFGQDVNVLKTLNVIQIICSIFFIMHFTVLLVVRKLRYFQQILHLLDTLLIIFCDCVVLANTSCGLVGCRWTIIPAAGGFPFILGIGRLLRLPRLYHMLEEFSDEIAESVATNSGIFRHFAFLIPGYKMLKSMIGSLPGLLNVCMLLAIILFAFTTTGIQIFAKVAFYGNHSEWTNFRSFSRGFLTAIVMGTLSNWNYFMYGLAFSVPDCVPDPEYDSAYCGFNDAPGCIPLNGCGTWIAYPYMCAFVIVVAFVVINLFVGVILESYDEQIDPKLETIQVDTLFSFRKTWAKYDPHATTFINLTDVPALILEVSKPLGFGGEFVERSLLEQRFSSITLRVFSGNKINFKDLVLELSAYCLRVNAASQDMHLLVIDDQHREYIDTLLEPSSNLKEHLQKPVAIIKSKIFRRNTKLSTLQASKRRSMAYDEFFNCDESSFSTSRKSSFFNDDTSVRSLSMIDDDDKTVAGSSSANGYHPDTGFTYDYDRTPELKGTQLIDDDYTIASVNSFFAAPPSAEFDRLRRATPNKEKPTTSDLWSILCSIPECFVPYNESNKDEICEVKPVVVTDLLSVFQLMETGKLPLSSSLEVNSASAKMLNSRENLSTPLDAGLASLSNKLNLKEQDYMEPDLVKKIEFEGQKYLKSKTTGIIYATMKCPEGTLNRTQVGQWNDERQTIDFFVSSKNKKETEGVENVMV